MQMSQQADGSILLLQRKYIKKILEQFQMTECKAAPTPAVQEEDEKEEKVSNDVPYQRAVGCLISS